MNTTALAQDLAGIVGTRFVRSRPAELLTFAADGLPTHRAIPSCVVFPGSTREVSALLRHLHARGVPFVARGAGTGLSGGALAEAPAVLVALTRLARILAVDPANRRAVVEPGVVNAALARAAAPHGLQYAPDPSSQTACTIGGNVAENAGGPHCLKYGVTTNHVLALEVVLADGEVVRLGSASGEAWGPDLAGLFVGSEGTFGVATEITVRLVPLPPTVRTILADFTALRAAGEAVSRIIAEGIVPAALEMMDQSAIRIVEASIYAAGYPTDAAAVLLVECDGRAGGTAADIARAEAICRGAGARSVRTASTAAERERLWQGRKKAFGAMGRISARPPGAGHHGPAHRAARRARPRGGDRRPPPAAGDERLPRRRREPASQPQLRRRRPGAVRPRGGREPGDHGGVRRRRRHDHRRARRRRGQAEVRAARLRAGRPGADGRGARRLRSLGPRQPGQGAPDRRRRGLGRGGLGVSGAIPTRWVTQMRGQLADAERRLGLADRRVRDGDGGRALSETYPAVMAAALVRVWLADEAWHHPRTVREYDRMVRAELPGGFLALAELHAASQGFAGWRAEDAQPLVHEARAFLAVVRDELEARLTSETA